MLVDYHHLVSQSYRLACLRRLCLCLLLCCLSTCSGTLRSPFQHRRQRFRAVKCLETPLDPPQQLLQKTLCFCKHFLLHRRLCRSLETMETHFSSFLKSETHRQRQCAEKSSSNDRNGSFLAESEGPVDRHRRSTASAHCSLRRGRGDCVCIIKRVGVREGAPHMTPICYSCLHALEGTGN